MAKKKTSEVKTPAAVATAPPAGEYTVLARRYRPRQFADLVGQEPVAESLLNAIASHRVAHAYLFTGARGVGKTSTARILAKALNCVKGPTGTPCDECELCLAIGAGEDMDVLEIDGASNRGIDEIRDLRSNVQYRPSRSRYKVYIIDEVHMLTREAFNALLKTLEEPPPHVKFIFATTEASKIPITILSRCQRFDFAGIGTTGIVQRLSEIVASEGMQAEPEALTLIARRAGGSMRDAQSLLDQLLAFGEDKLTAEQVHRLLGTANEERVAALAGAIVDHDARHALVLLAQAVEQGLQLGELLDQLIDYWRDLMVLACAGAESETLSVTGNQRAKLKEQAEQLTPETVMAGLDVLVSAKNRMRFTKHGRVVFEMALMRLCQLENLVPISQLAEWVAGNGAAVSVGTRPAAQPAPNVPIPSISSVAIAEKKKEADSPIQQVSVPLTTETLQSVWQQVIAQVGLILSSELRKIQNVAIFGPNALVLRVPATYNLSSNHYLDASRLAKVEEVLSKIVGQACSVRLESVGLDSQEKPVAEPNLASVTAGKKQRQRATVAELPLIGKAMEVLGGQIVHMDEDFGGPTGEE